MTVTHKSSNSSEYAYAYDETLKEQSNRNYSDLENLAI